MDLLGNNETQKQETKSKKIVGKLLIISIIALIIVIIAMMVLTANKPKNLTYKLSINDTDINTSIIKATEEEYVVLEDISQALGYTYYNGEYLGEATEEKVNCYLKNKNEIVCFKINTKEIYKTVENSIIEKQRYNVKHNIISYENKICVAIDDFETIFNTTVNYSKDDLKIKVYTPTKLAEEYKNDITNKKLSITLNEDFVNLKTIAKGMLIVTNNGQYGVLDASFSTKIGTKYKSMKYDEYTNYFIVSDNLDKYGVITEEGNSKISLKYDSINIINYEPLLYEITKNQKHGVMDGKGNIIIETEYDKLACNGDSKNDINSVLIINKIDDEDDGIVVCKDSKYGIINLKTGNKVLDCSVDKINSRTNNNGKEEYFVVVNEEEIELKKYIKTINTVTVNLSNTIKNQIAQ